MRILVPATLLLALTGGCLYTGEIVLAPEAELSPSVAVNAMDPALTPAGGGGAAPILIPRIQKTVPFEILAIEDPNLDDTLTVRWFTDGDTELWGEDVIVPAAAESDRTAIRAPGGIGINLDLVDAFGDPPALGLHRVEAIISDAGFASPANDPRAENRDPAADANVHYLYWIVNVTE